MVRSPSGIASLTSFSGWTTTPIWAPAGGGMIVYDRDRGYQRQIHNIENTPFRTKFEKDVAQFQGCAGIVLGVALLMALQKAGVAD